MTHKQNKQLKENNQMADEATTPETPAKTTKGRAAAKPEAVTMTAGTVYTPANG